MSSFFADALRRVFGLSSLALFVIYLLSFIWVILATVYVVPFDWFFFGLNLVRALIALVFLFGFIVGFWGLAVQSKTKWSWLVDPKSSYLFFLILYIVVFLALFGTGMPNYYYYLQAGECAAWPTCAGNPWFAPWFATEVVGLGALSLLIGALLAAVLYWRVGSSNTQQMAIIVIEVILAVLIGLAALVTMIMAIIGYATFADMFLLTIMILMIVVVVMFVLEFGISDIMYIMAYQKMKKFERLEDATEANRFMIYAVLRTVAVTTVALLHGGLLLYWGSTLYANDGLGCAAVAYCTTWPVFSGFLYGVGCFAEFLLLLFVGHLVFMTMAYLTAFLKDALNMASIRSDETGYYVDVDMNAGEAMNAGLGAAKTVATSFRSATRRQNISKMQ